MKIALAILLIAIAAWFAASPLLALYELRSAVESEDTETIAERVDFPVLRQNLKDQFNGWLGDTIAGERDGSALSAIGGLLGGFVADRAIDAYVTPSGLNSLFRGRRPSERDGAKRPEPPDHRDSPGNGEAPTDRTSDTVRLLQNADMAYTSWNRFEVRVTDDDGDVTTLVLRRRGFGWKLTNVILPVTHRIQNAQEPDRDPITA